MIQTKSHFDGIVEGVTKQPWSTKVRTFSHPAGTSVLSDFWKDIRKLQNAFTMVGYGMSFSQSKVNENSSVVDPGFPREGLTYYRQHQKGWGRYYFHMCVSVNSGGVAHFLWSKSYLGGGVPQSCHWSCPKSSFRSCPGGWEVLQCGHFSCPRAYLNPRQGSPNQNWYPLPSIILAFIH